VRAPTPARRFALAIIALGLAFAPYTLRPRAAAEPAPPRWKLTWSDEFEGDRIDPAKWDFDLGNGFFVPGTNRWIAGWGNRELQYYTSEPTNVFVRDGALHIRAVKEPSHGFDYTSARLKSRSRDCGQLFNQKYGRFEFRAKLPTGKGLWSALWMLPQDEGYGPWPASGEIDVVEARGQEPSKIVGTLHYGGRSAHAQSGQDLQLPDGGTIADYHVYALEWEPGEIRWFIDGRHCATQSFWWSGKSAGGRAARPRSEADLHPWPAPFDRPFYLVMNLAVGGNFLGNPDATTTSPAEMLVDYVRVYKVIGGHAEPKPRGDGRLPFSN
jgi:beta-glucanase (GH16 family)